ncbi:MAG: ABC transporter permease [Deltaproteobacteria bacterium]|nr:ABC transporter permease [Deltaproteobacteria bacterium]
MHNTLAILRKELQIYFTTVIAYAGFGAYAFLMGLLFAASLNRYQQLTDLALSRQQPELLERLNFNDVIIAPMMSSGIWMFLFFVPFLTMRLFAEEKQSRTFELLMSAPIRSLEMVLGKFFAAALLIVVMSALPLLFPLILSLYGTGPGGSGGVEWAPVLAGTISVMLLGLTFATLGLFFSSLAESQIVAALLTFAALLVGFVLPMMAGRLEGDWRAVLEYLSPVTHVGRGLQGRIHLKDLVYFGTSILAFLVLTHRVVESHRWR